MAIVFIIANQWSVKTQKNKTTLKWSDPKKLDTISLGGFQGKSYVESEPVEVMK